MGVTDPQPTPTCTECGELFDHYADAAKQVSAILDHFAEEHPDHPMFTKASELPERGEQ